MINIIEINTMNSNLPFGSVFNDIKKYSASDSTNPKINLYNLFIFTAKITTKKISIINNEDAPK